MLTTDGFGRFIWAKNGLRVATLSIEFFHRDFKIPISKGLHAIFKVSLEHFPTLIDERS